MENVFDFLPVTFMLTIPDGKLQQMEVSIKKFSLFFDVLEAQKHHVIKLYKQKKLEVNLPTFAQIIAHQEK